ncbi:MAG: GNAT family N-acetyltransferase [Candidatus Levyibacteriota bacterium]|jgi:ribosomal protein S18 acetylase RimI-like enzyme
MKIVYHGKTKTGKEILVRYPEKEDVVEMMRFINNLSKEKTFIRFQGEQTSLDEETKYLAGILENINNKKAVQLLVFLGDKLIANSDIHMRDKTERHVGIFGIAVAKDYRNEGVGRLLMELLFEEARKEISGLKIVTLEVYAKNSIAKRIYERFGFKQYGLLPEGIFRGGVFEDAILMYKNTK